MFELWITTSTITIIKQISPNTSEAIFRFFATLEDSWAFPASPSEFALSAYNSNNINKSTEYIFTIFILYLFIRAVNKIIVSYLLCMSIWLLQCQVANSNKKCWRWTRQDKLAHSCGTYPFFQAPLIFFSKQVKLQVQI